MGSFHPVEKRLRQEELQRNAGGGKRGSFYVKKRYARVLNSKKNRKSIFRGRRKREEKKR